METWRKWRSGRSIVCRLHHQSAASWCSTGSSSNHRTNGRCHDRQPRRAPPHPQHSASVPRRVPRSHSTARTSASASGRHARAMSCATSPGAGASAAEPRRNASAASSPPPRGVRPLRRRQGRHQHAAQGGERGHLHQGEAVGVPALPHRDAASTQQRVALPASLLLLLAGSGRVPPVAGEEGLGGRHRWTESRGWAGAGRE